MERAVYKINNYHIGDIMAGEASAWGGLVSAGIGLAAAFASKPYYAVQQYDVKQFGTKKYHMSAAPVPDNSVDVYNRAYAKAAGRRNSLEVMFKGERDITSARLKGVKERTSIGLSQDEAEANIKLNAAWGGVRGGSIKDNIYQTHANAAYRIGDQATAEDNSIERGKASVYKGKSGAAVTKDDYSVHTQFTGGNHVFGSDAVAPTDRAIGGSGYSLSGAILASLSAFDSQFFSDLGLALEDSPDSMNNFVIGNDWNNTDNLGLV